MSSFGEIKNPDVPSVSSALVRHVLLGELRDAENHRLTLISAPPGYGKTTLVAQFAQQTRFPVAWHMLDERERDLPNLFMHSLNALEQIIPAIQELKQIPFQYAPQDFAFRITSFLKDHLKQDIFYILDDMHYLVGSPAAEQWLRAFMETMPPRCHLIIISRVLPDLPLVEMIARREILAIGQEKLSFSSRELDALAQNLTGTNLSPAAKGRIEALEGWPAGVILALQPLPAEIEAAIAQQGEGPEALFYFLANSMLNIQLPDIRNFLLSSSILNQMSPEVCSKVLGLPNAHELLASVLGQNLFVSTVAGGIMYHQLFRDFLQSTLKKLDPERYIQLNLRAARWFYDGEQHEMSFLHFMAADDFMQAAQIAEYVAQDFFAQGRIETLLEWKSLLIGNAVQIPNLLYRCAIIHSDRYQYDQAEQALAIANQQYADCDDSTGVTLTEFHHAVINMQRGRYREAAQQAEALSRRIKGRENPHLHSRTLRVMGVANFRLGQLETALAYLEEALPEHREYGDTYALASLLQDMGAVYLQLNRLTDAAACLHEVVALMRSLNNPVFLALALNNLGYYCRLQGDYQQAFQAFQEGLMHVSQATNPRAEGYLLGSFADLLRDVGSFKRAHQLYKKCIELIGYDEPSLRVSVMTSLSTMRRWQGRWDDAADMANEAVELAMARGLENERQIALASLWVARANQGQATAALDALLEVREKLQQQHIQIEVVKVSGLCAHVALLRSDTLAAENFLRAAAQSAQSSVIQPLVGEVMHTPILQSFVAERSTRYPQLISALSQLKAQAQESQESYVQAELQKTYSLRIFTLGQEIIERDGRMIMTSEWQALRAREMFFYLLFMGAADRDQICLTFWPDHSPQQVRSNFHTTLYRARKALGDDVIVYSSEIYQINPEIKVWCDAREIERFNHLSSHLSPHNARTEELWGKSVRLYRGEFLPSVDSEWAMSYRESYRENYLQALLGSAQCALIRGGFGDSLGFLRTALEVDPYREETHRAIMTCYARQGEKQKLRTHYESLKRLLKDELAILPSTETSSLANALLG
jgi:LuxR family transcriptional regulator, maltose regulon positive regulatory protein